MLIIFTSVARRELASLAQSRSTARLISPQWEPLHSIFLKRRIVEPQTDVARSNKLVTRFSRLLRWGLGAGCICLGIYFGTDWPVIIFGSVLFLTGFLRPRRC
jgi:hypothetical protein